MLVSLTIETPLGPLLAVADDCYLHYLNFRHCEGTPEAIQRDTRLLREYPRNDGTSNAILELIQKELKKYFEGSLKTFTTPLFLQGTDFQKTTWSALMTIPYGVTWSYAQLAQSIGKPTAFRAVANANGANNHLIIIPCHRVIYSDGSLGGYTAGLERKEYLLKIEMSLHTPTDPSGNTALHTLLHRLS